MEKPPSPFYSVVKIRIVKEKQKSEKKKRFKRRT